MPQHAIGNTEDYRINHHVFEPLRICKTNCKS